MSSLAEKISSVLEPEPNYDISSQGFRVRNYSNDYFFPSPRLKEGLEEVIILPENNKKYEIPNGSVWTYSQSVGFKPEILKSDVGCGFSAFFIDKQEYSQEFIDSLISSISEEGIKIGSGNHFIDFCEGHPYAKEKDLLLIHSDFNHANITPSTYEEAKTLEKKAVEKRIRTLEILLKRLGIEGDFYKNWTHNSVNKEDGKLIYRKGSINLEQTGGEGILGLNAYEGVYFYLGDMEDHQHSMQHGLGKKNIEKTTKEGQEIHKKGKIEVMKIHPERTPQNLYQEYNRMREGFLKYFNFKQSGIGFSKPKLVISTG